MTGPLVMAIVCSIAALIVAAYLIGTIDLESTLQRWEQDRADRAAMEAERVKRRSLRGPRVLPLTRRKIRGSSPRKSGASDGYVDCSDCGAEVLELDAFTITPPMSPEGRSSWFVCVTCWERVINDALLTRLR